MSNNDRSAFLLKDCESIYKYITTLASMRLAALGATLTILGLIVSNSTKQTTLFAGTSTALMVTLIVTISIRMIAVLNRAVFILFTYLAVVEKQMGWSGFASYWQRYVVNNPRDSASHAFVLASRAVNLIGIGFSISLMWTQYKVTVSPINIQTVCVGTVTIISVIVLIWNERTVETQMSPPGFMPRMERELVAAGQSLSGAFPHSPTNDAPKACAAVPEEQSLDKS